MGKPIRYAKIPDSFDETKQYIEQLEPVDMGDYIFVDVAIKDLPTETTKPEPAQNNEFTPYVPEPALEERNRADIDYLAIMTEVDLSV
jgi:hypothetical protein